MSFDSNKFITDVETLMSWNCGKVTETSTDNPDVVITRQTEKYDKYFSYTGLDGMSICREMQTEIRKLGYDCLVRVVFNGIRNMDHVYMIYVKTK